MVSPLHADLTGLPPTYIVVGGHETLLDDARRFTDQAHNSGVDVTTVEVPDMQHVFTFMAGRAPKPTKRSTTIAKWARDKLGLD